MADFTGGPGFGAFLATLLLVGGLILLLRSLNKHLRKVRVNPPAEEDPEHAATPGDTSSTQA